MKMAQVSTNNSTVAPSAGPFRCTRRKQANPRRKNGKCPFLALNFIFEFQLKYVLAVSLAHRRRLSLSTLNHSQPVTGNESEK